MSWQTVYTYTHDDPVNSTDPTGTESPTVIWNNSFGEQSDPETAGREATASRAFSVIPGVSALEQGYEGNYFTAGILGTLDVAPLGSFGVSALKGNMLDAGVKFAKGEEAHHIVAVAVKDFQDARDTLGNLGIRLDEAINGAKLDKQFHRGADSVVHGAEAARAITERIAKAAKSGADAVRKELQDIGKEIEKAGKRCTPKTGSHIC